MLDSITEVIDELNEELAHPAVYREADQTIHLSATVVRQILNTLHWAGDEIAQLTEDRRKALKLSLEFALRITELEDELDEYEQAERLAEQRLDYYAGAR